MSETVDGSIGGFHDNLCAAISIEVIDKKGRVVSARPNISAEVDSPEQGAIQSIGIENSRPGEAFVGIIL